jgi:hypothetical protein
MSDRSSSPAPVDASALAQLIREMRKDAKAHRAEADTIATLRPGSKRPAEQCERVLAQVHDYFADQLETLLAAPRAPLEPREDEIGLSVDMLDVDRLRKWAENVETYGPDLTLWAYPQFVSEWLRGLADRLDTTVRDIGVLRATRPRPALPQEPLKDSDR